MGIVRQIKDKTCTPSDIKHYFHHQPSSRSPCYYSPVRSSTNGPAPVQRTRLSFLAEKHLNLLGRSSSRSLSRRGLLALHEVRTLRNTAILREVQVQLAEVPPVAQQDDAERQHGDEEHVEDAVEDKAVSDGDFVSAVGETPGDGVQQPEEDGPAGEDDVVALDLEALGGQETRVEEGDGEQEVGDRAVGEEAPFVGRADVSA